MSTDTPVEQTSFFMEIAIQEQETSLADTPVDQATFQKQFCYQEIETKERDIPVVEEPTVSDTTVTGGLIWIKVIQNVIAFAFSGKAYIFDGNKFDVLGTPVSVIYPTLVSKDDVAYLVGGLKEDGTTPETLYVYGLEASEYKPDKDYVAFVIPETDVYVIDEQNVTRGIIRGIGATPVMVNWKLVSRKPFVAIVMEVKE